jgi:hypothetical protein
LGRISPQRRNPNRGHYRNIGAYAASVRKRGRHGSSEEGAVDNRSDDFVAERQKS